MSDPALQENNFGDDISAEDKREIMIEIDRVANENRMRVTDDLFSFTAQKNGAIFPIIVNVIGVLMLAGGIGLLAWLFRSQEQSLQDTGRRVASTESRLIEEIRREADAQLQAKETEINQIEQQLAAINSERNALMTTMQTQIASREAELRDQFNQELEEERTRLRALNLSEEEITRQLQAYEETRRQEYEQRLEQFRREQAAEQQRLENDLNNLEQQFSRTLTQANQERENLARENEQRLQQVQQEFQRQVEASQAQLGEAEAALAQLNEQRRRETLVRGQITGFYRATSEALGRNDYTTARARLRDLRTLLNEDSTLRIEALREQRPIELFVVSSIESFVSLQERFGNPETLQRLNDAALIQRVADLTNQASTALNAGDADRASALYLQAMRVIPSVAEGYDFFESRRSTTDVAQTQAINDAASAMVDQARIAAAAGNFTSAIDQFSQVLSTYPTSRFRQTAISGIQSSVNTVVTNFTTQNTALQSRTEDLDANLAALTVERDDLLSQRDTITGERNEARQRITALEGELAQTRTQITQLQNQLQTAQGTTTATSTRVAELEQDLARARDREAALQLTITTRNTELSATEARLSDTRTQLSQTQADLAQTRSTLAQTQGDLQLTRTNLTSAQEELAQARAAAADAIVAAQPTDQPPALTPEIQAELNQLRQVNQQVAGAQRLYQGYRTATGGSARITSASPTQVIAARGQLQQFLSGSEMSEFFPQLDQEVAAFESTYVDSGRQNALVDMADVVVDLGMLDTTTQRLDAVRRLQSGTTDPALREFLNELESLLNAN